MEFKRGVYEMALTELARFIPRQDHRNRYLRGSMRSRDQDAASGVGAPHRGGQLLLHPGVELPPGATFDPTPPSATAPGLSADGEKSHGQH